MALSLITPVGANFLRDWPSQNEINSNRIDEYAGPCLPSHALRTYTPVLATLGTQPELGAGTITGHYYRIFDIVFAWGEFRFGSGFVAGTGAYRVSLPFEIDTILPATGTPGRGPVIGTGYCHDASSSAGREPLSVAATDTTNMRFNTCTGATGRSVEGANIPITWAVDDGLSWSVRYRCVPTS